jgi:hypothetical protein
MNKLLQKSTLAASMLCLLFTLTAHSGNGSSGGDTTPPANPPSPLILPIFTGNVSMNYGIKRIGLSWPEIPNATFYRVMKKAGDALLYSQIGTDTLQTSYSDPVAVHLFDWLNTSYLVQACNAAGCTQSAPVFATDSKQAIGYFEATSPTQTNFASSIAINDEGSLIAAGSAHGEAVTIFVRLRNTWFEEATLEHPSSDSIYPFGRKVALSADGSTLAVSGHVINHDNRADDYYNYVVYIYTRSSSIFSNAHTWTLQATLKGEHTNESDEFGRALALSATGNTLAVGAPHEDSSSTGVNGDEVTRSSLPGAGAVFVFKRDNDSEWSQHAYIKASNTDAGDGFGSAIALSPSGITLAVGAAYIEGYADIKGESSAATVINGNQADNSAPNAGAVYVFSYTRAAGWSQQAYIKAPNTQAADAFGYDVALSGDGNTLAVGAVGEDSAANGINGSQSNNAAASAGAVYVYTRSGSIWSHQAYIKASNSDADDLFGTAIALSADGNTLAITAIGEDSAATAINGDQQDNTSTYSGAAHAFQRVGNSWVQRSYIKAPNFNNLNNEYLSFGRDVALNTDGKTLAVGKSNIDFDVGAVYLY